MKNKINNHIQRDYEDFTKQKRVSPNHLISSKISKMVLQELNPGHIKVFFKLLMSQGFIAVITMLFCPQFGLSLTNKYELFHYFHHTFGESICMLICGSIFMGSGAVFASSILKRNEILKIRKTKFLYYIAVVSTALPLLLLFGAEVYLNTLPYWLIGSISSGIILFECTSTLRFRVLE